MDFAFSEEQQMLREGARQFLSDRSSVERVVELAESDEGWDPASWKEIAGLGWTGLSIPEEHGGAGMNFVDEAVLFEELGYGLYPGPYFSTVALALPAYAGDDSALGRIASGELTATLAFSEPDGPVHLTDAAQVQTKAEGSKLTGRKVLVPDAGIVSEVVVVGSDGRGPALFAVDAGGEGVSIEMPLNIDRTRRLGSVALDGATGRLLVSGDQGAAVLERIRQRALAALALEAVGIAQRVLEYSVEYTKERKQFEKPIGTYQAVSHQVTDMYVDTELSRSLAYWAAWCVAEGDPQVPIATATAKSFAAEAAVRACERAIQVHGGIGFTWEHVLHRFYKRAQWIDSFGDPARALRGDIATELLGS